MTKDKFKRLMARMKIVLARLELADMQPGVRKEASRLEQAWIDFCYRTELEKGDD